MQDIKPITTAISKLTGRLKVDAVSCNKKKGILKKILNKRDGKGGVGALDAPGYGPAPKKSLFPKSTTNKPHRSTKSIGGIRLKGFKKIPSIPSAINALNKKMKFKKTLKSSVAKVKSLKSIVKTLI